MARRMKRRRFLRDGAKVGLGLALAQVGGATPGLAQQPPAGATLPGLTYRVYRTVLLISMAQRKAGLSKDDRVKRVARVAPSLRNLPGVRHIEAVVFDGWRDDSGAFRDAPWKPNGALIFAESKDPAGLKTVVDRIYKAAKGLDQEMVVMEPLGDLDSW